MLHCYDNIFWHLSHLRAENAHYEVTYVTGIVKFIFVFFGTKMWGAIDPPAPPPMLRY